MHTCHRTLSYQFYQSASHLTISIMEKKVKKEEATVDIDSGRVNVTVARAGTEVRSH